MIKIGDKVKFLNDVGGGKVTSFLNKNMVNVENNDGFEIPYLISQLVNVSRPVGEEKESAAEPVKINDDFVSEQETKLQTGRILDGKDSPDFYFCFVPDNSTNPLAGETNLYLVNDSNFTLFFHYSHFKNENYKTVKHDTVQPNSRIRLESLIQEDLIELPEYCFQLLFFRTEDIELHQSVIKKFKVSPVKFYKEKSFLPNLFFEKNALVLQIAKNILNIELDKLTQNDFTKVVSEKEVNPEIKKPRRKRTAEIVEFDLHIQELIDNTAGLSNREILDIQLEKVESEMRLAIQSGIKRVVFIHGVGQGVLKQEVAKRLKSKFPKYYFQDASFKEYGYGATMVILRKG